MSAYFWMIFYNNHHWHILGHSSNKLNDIRMSDLFQQRKLMFEGIAAKEKNDHQMCNGICVIQVIHK